MVGIVRHLTSIYEVLFIVFARQAFALLFLLPTIAKNYKTIFPTKKLHLHLFRNINGLLSVMLWFYAISEIDLPQAVSITFLTPILTTVAASIFLKEKVSKKTSLAIILGFIGMLIIVRPGFVEIKPAHILAMCSTMLWAISNVLIKTLTKTEKPLTISVYTALIMCLASTPLAFPYLDSLKETHDLLWFATLGIISNLSQITLTTALSKSDLSSLQPFDFTRLIFASIIAYFAFNEIVNISTIIGSLIILLAAIYQSPFKFEITRFGIWGSPRGAAAIFGRKKIQKHKKA